MKKSHCFYTLFTFFSALFFMRNHTTVFFLEHNFCLLWRFFFATWPGRWIFKEMLFCIVFFPLLRLRTEFERLPASITWVFVWKFIWKPKGEWRLICGTFWVAFWLNLGQKTSGDASKEYWSMSYSSWIFCLF